MRSLVSGYRPSYLNKLGISSSLIEQSSAINPSLQIQVPFVQFPLKLQSFGHRFCTIFTGGTEFPSSSLSYAEKFFTAWNSQVDFKPSKADSAHLRSPVNYIKKSRSVWKIKIHMFLNRILIKTVRAESKKNKLIIETAMDVGIPK